MTSRIDTFADRFSSARVQKHLSGMRISFTTAVILGAIALPIVAFGNGYADAETLKPGTLKEVTSRGMVMSVQGMDIDVTYTADGKFTAMDGQVTGAWRIDGDKLCTTNNFQPEESCSVYPKDKKSGDTFELATDQGSVTIRIK